MSGASGSASGLPAGRAAGLLAGAPPLRRQRLFAPGRPAPRSAATSAMSTNAALRVIWRSSTIPGRRLPVALFVRGETPARRRSVLQPRSLRLRALAAGTSPRPPQNGPMLRRSACPSRRPRQTRRQALDRLGRRLRRAHPRLGGGGPRTARGRPARGRLSTRALEPHRRSAYASELRPDEEQLVEEYAAQREARERESRSCMRRVRASRTPRADRPVSATSPPSFKRRMDELTRVQHDGPSRPSRPSSTARRPTARFGNVPVILLTFESREGRDRLRARLRSRATRSATSVGKQVDVWLDPAIRTPSARAAEAPHAGGGTRTPTPCGTGS